MHLDRILRYPVKSLSVERLDRAPLIPGQGLPYDRHWGLARPDGEATQDGAWHSKKHFVVLVREYGLARLNSRFDETTGLFAMTGPNGLAVEGDLNTPSGRAAIAGTVARHLGLADEAAPTLVKAKSLGYFDTTRGPISILNLESHRALERVMEQDLDPVRFRMNLLLEGAEPWAEEAWPGRRVKIGDAVLEVTEPTGRCKATHINPDSADADAEILRALKRHFGNTRMGVYAEVVEGGEIKPGDTVALV